ENQPHLGLPDRLAGNIPLDLALIGPKIRQRQKQSPRNTTPESISVVEIQTEIQRLGFTVESGQFPGIGEGEIDGEFIDDQIKGEKLPAHNAHHLVLLSDIDRLGSPTDRVDDNQNSHDVAGHMKNLV